MVWFSLHPETFDACPCIKPAILACPTSSEVMTTQIGRTSEDRACQVVEHSSQDMWAGVRAQTLAATEVM